MPLQVSSVERLEDVLGHAIDFLSRDGDLFARPRIVVPTPGAKAWLQDRLARELGTSGPRRDDGVVATIEITFPGMITSLLQPPPNADAPDPWSLDRLTFAVLDVITGPDAATFGIPYPVSREPLLSARRIAALFDTYQVRRPGMIREWELSDGNRFLHPTANDEQQDGSPKPAKLREGDLWQFDVWRAVRRLIGQPSPPARTSVDHQPGRERLLVAGLQSLALPQLECLERLGDVCDVEAILVHPSPGLKATWRASGQKPLPPLLRGRPLQRSKDPLLLEGVDQLLPVWLAGARELQDLLGAQGISVTDSRAATTREYPDTLLGRMQRTIALGGEAEPQPHDRGSDHSLVIHRCHSLSRQAEVLHDALLQAFAEIEDLQPHDVAIVSPCIEKASPHLEAVFQRTVVGRDTRGGAQRIALPLVVADRGIRETSEAADLLAALLALPGSRASIDDVLSVAGHPLVRAAFGVDDAAVATWTDFVERTAVRWGLDAGHRARHGLQLAANADVHTWILGLERMLLGAMLPDAAAQPELGGVVPLADLDPVDLVPITTLVRIFDVIRTLDAATADRRPVAAWCDAIEQALVGLCGEECPHLVEPLAQLRRLREGAAGTAAERLPLPFEDVHHLLVAWLEEKSGRQPLRTGAITAASMVPLRGVPFKVICVCGYDDGAVGGGEADGDDLVTRQQLVGDVDPRADERRTLLDCLLAAGTRLVITCNGRNVKSNKPVPLVTPLAELVDFAVRHGVARERLDKPSGIEIEHPRHHLSRKNFLLGDVQKGLFWSHDRLAGEVAGVVDPELPEEGDAAAAIPSVVAGIAADAATPVIDLSMLEMLVDDPLKLFLTKTLGIAVWRKGEEETPATLPLALERRQIRHLTLQLLELFVTTPAAVEPWKNALRRSGILPLGTMGEMQLEEIAQLVAGIATKAAADGVPLVGLSMPDMRVDVGSGVFAAHLPGFHEPTGTMVMIRADRGDKAAYGCPLHVAAIRLVAARAAGLKVEKVSVVARHNDWEPGAFTPAGRPVPPCQIRTVRLGDDVEPVERLSRWCEMACEALAARRGLFGLREATPRNRVEKFEAFVGAKNFDTGTSGYPHTSEAVAYGLSPVFAEIFPEPSPELAFLDRHVSLFRLEASGMTYVLR